MTITTTRYQKLAITWFCITTILLCIPGSALPDESRFKIPLLDKWVHIVIFGTLSWLVYRGSFPFLRENKYSYHIALYCTLYGVLMEFVQGGFIPNRSFDVKDILGDAVGALLGWLIFRRSIKK